MPQPGAPTLPPQPETGGQGSRPFPEQRGSMTSPEAPRWTPLMVPSTGSVSVLGKRCKGTPEALRTDPPISECRAPWSTWPVCCNDSPGWSCHRPGRLSAPLVHTHRARRLAPMWKGSDGKCLGCPHQQVVSLLTRKSPCHFRIPIFTTSSFPRSLLWNLTVPSLAVTSGKVTIFRRVSVSR